MFLYCVYYDFWKYWFFPRFIRLKPDFSNCTQTFLGKLGFLPTLIHRLSIYLHHHCHSINLLNRFIECSLFICVCLSICLSACPVSIYLSTQMTNLYIQKTIQSILYTYIVTGISINFLKHFIECLLPLFLFLGLCCQHFLNLQYESFSKYSQLR